MHTRRLCPPPAVRAYIAACCTYCHGLLLPAGLLLPRLTCRSNMSAFCPITSSYFRASEVAPARGSQQANRHVGDETSPDAGLGPGRLREAARCVPGAHAGLPPRHMPSASAPARAAPTCHGNDRQLVHLLRLQHALDQALLQLGLGKVGVLLAQRARVVGHRHALRGGGARADSREGSGGCLVLCQQASADASGTPTHAPWLAPQCCPGPGG